MAQKLTAGLPENLDLGPGFIVQLAAVDPTTGANVATVNVSGVAIVARTTTPAAAGDDPGQLVPVGPFMLVPGPSDVVAA